MYQLFFEGEGKPQPAGPKGTGKLGLEERGLFDAFKKLGKRDRKFVVAMVRKMAKENKAAKRSS
jgi:hypothetical protein